MATSLDTRAFTGTYPVELPTTGLLARVIDLQPGAGAHWRHYFRAARHSTKIVIVDVDSRS